MSDTDQEIIDTVDEWTKAEQLARATFWKQVFRITFILVVATGLVALGSVVIPYGIEQGEKREQEKQYERYRQQEAWVECVSLIGLETCQLVRDGLVAECEGATDFKSCIRRVR